MHPSIQIYMNIRQVEASGEASETARARRKGKSTQRNLRTPETVRRCNGSGTQQAEGRRKTRGSALALEQTGNVLEKNTKHRAEKCTNALRPFLLYALLRVCLIPATTIPLYALVSGCLYVGDPTRLLPARMSCVYLSCLGLTEGGRSTILVMPSIPFFFIVTWYSSFTQSGFFLSSGGLPSFFLYVGRKVIGASTHL